MKKIFSFALMILGVAAVMTSCSEDRDSNPALVQPTEFILNTPSYSTQKILLQETDSLLFSWSQPQFTTGNAPVVATYEIQVGNSTAFSKEYDNDAEDASLNEGADYVVAASGYVSCLSNLSQADLDKALNKLNKYEKGSTIDPTTAYIRVRGCVETTGSGIEYSSIASNIVTLTVQPYWVDVEKVNAPANLWMPGAGNEWTHSVAPIFVYDESSSSYDGYAYIDGDFKFTSEAGWSGEEFNTGSFTTCSTGNVSKIGEGSDNITCTDPAGMFHVVINMKTKDIALYPCTWSIIGDFNSWGSDVDMTYDTTEHCLVASNVGATAAGWKFRMDHDWSVNLGGSLEKLTVGGDNIEVAANKVKLYIENQKKGKYATAE